MAPPQATIVTAGLVGRWIAEYGDLIRSDRQPEISAVTVGNWGNLDDRDRARLTEIGHDILWRLIEIDALITARVQQVSKVERDYRGRRLGSPNLDAPDGSAPTCVCGQPTVLGTVHRLDGPCYVPGGVDAK